MFLGLPFYSCVEQFLAHFFIGEGEYVLIFLNIQLIFFSTNILIDICIFLTKNTFGAGMTQKNINKALFLLIPLK